MKGRTRYVIPYVMGPLGSTHSKVGLELTDSVCVALNMRIMTRTGRPALAMLGDSNDFNRGLHSTLDCSPERRFICHFPQDNTIWSVGSGYGGEAARWPEDPPRPAGRPPPRPPGRVGRATPVLVVCRPAGERTSLPH